MRLVVLTLLITGATSTPSRADNGLVNAVVTKGGFVVGVGGGRGTLIFHGHSYPLIIGGMSFGATIGLSTAYLRGHAYHMRTPEDIEGTYSALEGSMTAGPGQGGLEMKNDKGVVISAHSTSSGLKLAFAPSGVQIKLKH